MPKFVGFKAIKAAVTMEQVLQRYGLLDTFKHAQSGDSLSGPCPIHRGSNPTQFRVSLSKNCWNCFSDCNCGGNVLDFVAKKEDISLHTAALPGRIFAKPQSITSTSPNSTTMMFCGLRSR